MKHILTFFISIAALICTAAGLEDKLMSEKEVIIPPGKHTISRTIEVTRDLTVIMKDGAEISSSANPVFNLVNGTLRICGEGKGGIINGPVKGGIEYSPRVRTAAISMNNIKTSASLYLNNVEINSFNGVDGYAFSKTEPRVEYFHVNNCRFKTRGIALGLRSVKLGEAKVEHCFFTGGTNPIYLNTATERGMIIRSNYLKDFGVAGIKIGKAGQITEGCTTHLTDTIVHDNRLIGGGRSATERDAYIHGILIYGNNVSVQGNIVRNVNRGEPIPGRAYGQQIRLKNGTILKGKWHFINNKRHRLAGAAIYLKANRAIVSSNICTNSGWRSVIEIKTGGREHFVSVSNNIVDGSALAIEDSYGFECNSGRSMWQGNIVYNMPYQAFAVRSGYENTFIGNLLIDCEIGFGMTGRAPGVGELISNNRFINVKFPVDAKGKPGMGNDIYLPSTVAISPDADLPEAGKAWYGRQLVRGKKLYICLGENNNYFWMELQGKIIPPVKYTVSGKEMVANGNFATANEKNVLQNWSLWCQNAREGTIAAKDRNITYDKKVFHSGKQSLKFNFPSTTATWSIKHDLKLIPRRRYRATAVVKADKGTRLSLFALPSGAEGKQVRNDETNTNWQTITVDFVQPANSMTASVGLSCGKVPPNYSTWIDSISVRELSREDGTMPSVPEKTAVKTVGSNQMPEKLSWRAVNCKITAAGKESLKISTTKDGAIMLTGKVKLAAPGKWQFSAALPPGCAIRVIPASGKMIKANGDQAVEFTTTKAAETVQIQFWLPLTPAGTLQKVNKMALFKLAQ